MTTNLRIALVVITVIYLFLIIKAIKNKKLQISFSMFWILSGILLIIAILIPNLVEYFTKLLGFELSSNMIFCITIFIAFYLIFQLTIRLSKENEKNIALVQEVSILKKRVQEIEEKLEKKDD